MVPTQARTYVQVIIQKSHQTLELINTKGGVQVGLFSGGGVQGRIFEDIETGFFAIIHICVQLTFISYDLFCLTPPKGGNPPPPSVFRGLRSQYWK